MKTIGLVRGMSWESTLEYYRIIHETVKEKLGGFPSAQIVVCSVDFAGIEVLIPNEEERQAIHAVIYHELCLGTVKDASREAFKKITRSRFSTRRIFTPGPPATSPSGTELAYNPA